MGWVEDLKIESKLNKEEDMKLLVKLIEIKYKYIIVWKFYSWSSVRKKKNIKWINQRNTLVDWELRFKRVILVMILESIVNSRTK